MPILKRRTGHVQQWDTLVWYQSAPTEIVRGSHGKGPRGRDDRGNESDEEDAIESEAYTEYIRSWPEVRPSLSLTPSGLRLFPPVHAAFDRTSVGSIPHHDDAPIRPLRVPAYANSFRPTPVPRPWSHGSRRNGSVRSDAFSHV